MQEELAETAAEFFDTEVALDKAAVTDRDLSGFLGNHNRDGIGFLAEAEAGAVAEAEVAIEVLALGERENAGGGDDAVAAEDQPSIMKHGLRLEEREDEIF